MRLHTQTSGDLINHRHEFQRWALRNTERGWSRAFRRGQNVLRYRYILLDLWSCSDHACLHLPLPMFSPRLQTTFPPSAPPMVPGSNSQVFPKAFISIKLWESRALPRPPLLERAVFCKRLGSESCGLLFFAWPELFLLPALSVESGDCGDTPGKCICPLNQDQGVLHVYSLASCHWSVCLRLYCSSVSTFSLHTKSEKS